MSRDWNIVDDDDVKPAPEPPQDGLDSRRIHLIVEERRAANRAGLRRRIVVPVAFGIALAAAVRAAFAWQTSRAFAIACALTAAIAAVVALRTWRSSVQTADRASSSPPPSSPDFEGLGGDGDAASRLAKLRDDP